MAQGVSCWRGRGASRIARVNPTGPRPGRAETAYSAGIQGPGVQATSSLVLRMRPLQGQSSGTSTYTVQLPETVALSEALTAASRHTEAVGDTTAVSDAAAAALLLNATVGDTVAASDTLTTQALYSQDTGDTVGVADQATSTAVYSQTSGDTVAVSDLASAGSVFSSQVSDTLGASDALVAQAVLAPSVGDTVAASDAATSAVVAQALVGDTVGVTDTPSVVHTQPVSLGDTVGVSEFSDATYAARPSLAETVSQSESLSVAQGALNTVVVTEPVAVLDGVSVVRTQTPSMAGEMVVVVDQAAVGQRTTTAVSDAVVVLDALGGVGNAVAQGDGRGVQVLFGRELPWPQATDLASYVFSGTGYPLVPLAAAIQTYVLGEGSTATIVGPHEVQVTGASGGSYTGKYLRLTSALNPDFVQVVDDTGGVSRTLRVAQPLFLDPAVSGWEVRSGAIGALVGTPKMTAGALYQLHVFGQVIPFEGVAPRPRLGSVLFDAETGTVEVLFAEAMREDAALTNPQEYAITGPSSVQVVHVRPVSSGQVLLETSGFGPGSYTLTVNATGTPKDLAGNPVDPVFNQAIFDAVAPLQERSIFTDKGPIARPPLSLQTGTGATAIDPVTIELTGAALSTVLVGKYLRLVGMGHSDGDFRITSVLNPTRCKVAASFTLPDGGVGVSWEVYDPRDGQIADDPSHVRVRVNGLDVVPEAVVGLLGQVVLPAAPLPADDVQVDYSWICDPTVEVQRLNSREFRLNNHAQLLPGDSGHTYAYKNVLLTPGDYTATTVVQSGVGATLLAPNTVQLPGGSLLAGFVGLSLALGGINEGLPYRITGVLTPTSVTVSPNPLPGPAVAWEVVDDQITNLATLSQPLQRDLKYRAYEREYTAALNDPTLLVLNTPDHRIAYPPLERPLDEVFVNYQPNTLPENDPQAPWTFLGTGVAVLAGVRLVVDDTTTGPFPGGQPTFWVRPIDATFPHVLAMTWQVEVPAVPTYQGVWSGVAAGYAGPERALVVGLLEDAGVKKVGVLRVGQGNNPGELSAWGGGLDGDNLPTLAPATLDWTTLRSYRVLRGTDGVVRVFFDGAVVESLRVLESELPFLAELNDPFDQLQGAFFGSLSREARNQSIWDFVRYTVIPTNPLQTAPYVFASYEGNVPPEGSTPLWTPAGYHGTETVLLSGALLLDSTSATTPATSALAGLVGGDFRGYVRLEPLLGVSADVVLDVYATLRTHTHGPRPDAVMAAYDDGDRLVQLSLFPDRAAPLLGYGGRSLPTDWDPTPWSSLGSANAEMVGRTLRITDTDVGDGRVFYVDDLALPGADARVVGNGDYMAECRCLVRSYTPDIGGFAGATMDVYDSTRAVGLMLREVAGVRYLTFHSEGVPLVAGEVAFEWFDGKPHTYRLTKSTTGNLVSLFVDGVFLSSVDYSDFAVPVVSLVGTVSFGSATVASSASLSEVDWFYANTWRVWPGVKRYAGLWKGTTTNTLRDFHLPVRAQGQGELVGNVLGDSAQDFVAQGVVAGDKLVIDDGDNAGVYEVVGVNPTTLTLSTAFPVQPSAATYRVPREVDWSVQHRYRIVRSALGTVSLLLDADPTPLVRVDYSNLSFPPSSAGVVSKVAGMAAVAWGALDPTALTQSEWAAVRYGITRSPTEMRIVPQGQVLNQRNVMASPEHIFTSLPHEHTDFWAGSDGVPPHKFPDFLQDPSLVAFTLLNEGTPLVPLTQTSEVRNIQPSEVFVSALNMPEDVLNTDADFTLNDGTTRIELVFPDDVLYSALEVLETTTGSTDLIAPFCDDCPGPTFQGVNYQKEVCLTYDGTTLPEDDTAAPTPWELVSDNPAQVTTQAFSGTLTYATTGPTTTVYRNVTPLPDAPGLITEVTFRLRVAQDGTFGLGDSQVRLGLSASPNVTAALAFLTSPLGQRYVLLVDLNNNAVLGGILFDWYDGLAHTYRLVRDPGAGVLRVFVD